MRALFCLCSYTHDAIGDWHNIRMEKKRKRVGQRKYRPSMVRVGKLWVDRGVPKPGVNMERMMDEIREERFRHIRAECQ